MERTIPVSRREPSENARYEGIFKNPLYTQPIRLLSPAEDTHEPPPPRSEDGLLELSHVEIPSEKLTADKGALELLASVHRQVSAAADGSSALVDVEAEDFRPKPSPYLEEPLFRDRPLRQPSRRKAYGLSKISLGRGKDDGPGWPDAVCRDVGGLEEDLQAEKLAVGRHVLAFLAETLKPPTAVGDGDGYSDESLNRSNRRMAAEPISPPLLPWSSTLELPLFQHAAHRGSSEDCPDDPTAPGTEAEVGLLGGMEVVRIWNPEELAVPKNEPETSTAPVVHVQKFPLGRVPELSTDVAFERTRGAVDARETTQHENRQTIDLIKSCKRKPAAGAVDLGNTKKSKIEKLPSQASTDGGFSPTSKLETTAAQLTDHSSSQIAPAIAPKTVPADAPPQSKEHRFRHPSCPQIPDKHVIHGLPHRAPATCPAATIIER